MNTGMRRRACARTGLTLVEIIASMLILSVGALSVIGLMLYGLGLAGRAQAAATGMETARTMLADRAPIGLRDATILGTTVSGYLNGYFVRRTEVAEPAIAPSGNAIKVVTVTAEVFQAGQGNLVATLRERQVSVCSP